jgi:hypothetical protein
MGEEVGVEVKIEIEAGDTGSRKEEKSGTA